MRSILIFIVIALTGVMCPMGGEYVPDGFYFDNETDERVHLTIYVNKAFVEENLMMAKDGSFMGFPDNSFQHSELNYTLTSNSFSFSIPPRKSVVLNPFGPPPEELDYYFSKITITYSECQQETIFRNIIASSKCARTHEARHCKFVLKGCASGIPS